MSQDDEALVVCEHCGQVHRSAPFAAGTTARCVRCEAILGRGHSQSISTLLALTVTAGIVFLVGINTNVLLLRLRGSGGETLPAAIAGAWDEGQHIVALVAATTALVAPALFIVLRLYVLAPLAAGKVPPGFAFCVRLLHHAARWNMIEVFTIGVLLSLVRLAGMADASPGPGLFALGIVTLLFAAIESAGLKHLWWQV